MSCSKKQTISLSVCTGNCSSDEARAVHHALLFKWSLFIWLCTLVMIFVNAYPAFIQIPEAIEAVRQQGWRLRRIDALEFKMYTYYFSGAISLLLNLSITRHALARAIDLLKIKAPRLLSFPEALYAYRAHRLAKRVNGYIESWELYREGKSLGVRDKMVNEDQVSNTIDKLRSEAARYLDIAGFYLRTRKLARLSQTAVSVDDLATTSLEEVRNMTEGLSRGANSVAAALNDPIQIEAAMTRVDSELRGEVAPPAIDKKTRATQAKAAQASYA